MRKHSTVWLGCAPVSRTWSETSVTLRHLANKILSFPQKKIYNAKTNTKPKPQLAPIDKAGQQKCVYFPQRKTGTQFCQNAGVYAGL